MSITEKLAENLKVAADQLRKYETLHRAKNTEDGLAKAEVNAALASQFEEVLTEYYNGLES